MKICVLGPFDPASIRDYLSPSSREKIVSINITATSVNSLVLSLIKLKHEVTVLTLDTSSSNNKVFLGNNVSIHIIGVKSFIPIFNFFPPPFLMSQKLKNYLIQNSIKFDVLHAQWAYEYAYACASFVEKSPVFCTVRDWAPSIYSFIPPKPFLLSIVKKLYWKQKILISNKVLNNGLIHFISNSFYTQQNVLNINKNYIVPIIFNSIDDSLILLERLDYPIDPVFVSISPSIDDKRKNCDSLIKAFSLFNKKYPKSKLLFIGKVGYEKVLYKEWKKLNILKNVEFLGYMKHADLIEVLDNASCLVHPSLEETFGNVFLEGMARRVPVIGGSTAGAVPHVLKHGLCGALCDVSSPEFLYDTMVKIIENKQYANNLINKATEVLCEEYSGTMVAKRHIELYMSI